MFLQSIYRILINPLIYPDCIRTQYIPINLPFYFSGSLVVRQIFCKAAIVKINIMSNHFNLTVYNSQYPFKKQDNIFIFRFLFFFCLNYTFKMKNQIIIDEKILLLFILGSSKFIPFRFFRIVVPPLPFKFFLVIYNTFFNEFIQVTIILKGSAWDFKPNLSYFIF